ncbi:hypothetical protein FQR65_LT13293 [Abscondita terminalis]|nr:hypothetical protein FQR65_LT13293 [Abscondita terminalis]
MFVSSMLKKCVNLLSHDFSKSILKKEIHNDEPGRVSLEAEEVIIHEENKNEEDSTILNNYNTNCTSQMEVGQKSKELNTVINNNNSTQLGEVINTDINMRDVGDETLILHSQQDTIILSAHDENCDETTISKCDEFPIEIINGIIGNNDDEVVNTDVEMVETERLSLIQGDDLTPSKQNESWNELPLKYEIPNVAALVDCNFEFSKGTDFIIQSQQEQMSVELIKNVANHDANLPDKTPDIINDCTHERSTSGNSLFNICENVADTNYISLIQPTDILQSTVFYTSEPSLANDIECRTFQEPLQYCEKDTKVFENQSFQASDITQNLGVIVDIDVTNIFDVGVEDNSTDCSTLVKCVKSLGHNNIDKSVTNESGSEFIRVDRNLIDVEIIKQESKDSAITTSIIENKISKTMADLSEKNMNLEEEIADLKLQLNASHQVRAGLELQLTQKEEIIIKSQTEALRKQQSYKQEIKQLKDKLDEKNSEEDNTPLKELQETNKSLKLREGKLLSELNARKIDEQNYRKIMEEFDKTIAAQVSELKKLNEEHSVVKRHLATLEMAFSDVLQKYERSKQIIEGFKSNEDALRQSFAVSEDNIVKSEQKYETLKAHAKAQIEKCNQEILLMREQYDSEIHKLTAIVKRLEIKNASLTNSLDQKNKECSALAALCDEVTGKV